MHEGSLRQMELAPQKARLICGANFVGTALRLIHCRRTTRRPGDKREASRRPCAWSDRTGVATS
jgi:hypothetical protein